MKTILAGAVAALLCAACAEQQRATRGADSAAGARAGAAGRTEAASPGPGADSAPKSGAAAAAPPRSGAAATAGGAGSQAAPSAGGTPAAAPQAKAAGDSRAAASAGAGSAGAGAAGATEAGAPRPGTPSITAPTITRTPGGVGLLELPVNDKAIVNVELRFRSGAVDDPPGKAGLTYLTARVMTRGGTKALDAKALLNALFPLAAELDVRVDKELTSFMVRVHKDNLEKLLPILRDVVLAPRWDPGEFKRLREEAVNDVEKRLRQGDDENLGKEALWELLYRNHPYGRLTLGHVADLKSLSLEDVKAHAARVFTADRLVVGISGGYPAQLGGQLAQAFAALPQKSAAAAQVPQAQPRGPRFLLVEKVTDSTAISLGMPWALSHKDPDFAAMTIARSAFGEHRQFNGRLMQRLREARGLNYGDYAYIEHFQQDGGDAATAQTGRARHQQELSIWLRPVQNENRLFALRAALYELQRSVKDEPFSEKEVAQTKGFLDGYLLLFDQTDARRLGYALDDAFYGMNGFLGTLRAQLREVSTDQVNAAWRKWVDPARVQAVLAGPGMAEVKKAILSGAPSPMHYQKDAQGNAQAKPKALTDVDEVVQALPLGAHGEADVEIVPVEQMFE